MADEYEEAIAGRRGTWSVVLIMDGIEINSDNIMSLVLHELEFGKEKVGVGSAVSSYVEIELYNDGTKYSNKSLTFKIGLKPQGSENILYEQFGTFYVTDVEEGELGESIEIVAYDKMKKVSGAYRTSLEYPASLKSVTEELAASCGITLNPDFAFPDIELEKQFKVKKKRKVLKKIAELLGANAVVNRSNQLDFRWLSETNKVIDADRYWEFKKADRDSYIKAVSCIADDEMIEAYNSTQEGMNGLTVSFKNNKATQEIVDQILAKISCTFRSGEADFLGDVRIKAGDIITISDIAGSSYRIPVMENIIEFDGGISNSVRAFADTEELQEITADEMTLNDSVDEVGDVAENTKTEVQKVQQEGIKILSVSVLPDDAGSHPNTVYLIQGEVNVT